MPGLVAEAPIGACERPGNTLVGLRWHDAPIAHVAQRLGGPDPRWTSGYLSLKAPGSGALVWHQDWWCWDHPITRRRAPAQIAVVCYLADKTAASGALRVLPGSHHRRHPLHDDDGCTADQPDQQTLEGAAGDAFALDYRLLHGTHPNRSDEARDSVILNFTPDWAGLPADLRSHLVGGLGLPTAEERPTTVEHVLPPAAPVHDLALNRCVPAGFSAIG